MQLPSQAILLGISSSADSAMSPGCLRLRHFALASGAGQTWHFELASPNDMIDFFLSHSWHDDGRGIRRAHSTIRSGEPSRAGLASQASDSIEAIVFFLSHSWHDDGWALLLSGAGVWRHPR